MIKINAEGGVQNLIDKDSGKDYLALGQEAPFMRIRQEGELLAPNVMEFDKNKGLMTLRWTKAGAVATVAVVSKAGHISFELTAMDPEEGVELVIWGPFPVLIRETVGETVGIVSDGKFAVGIQSLNLKTLGGYPSTEDDVMPMYNLFAGEDYSDISADEKDKELFRGDTARPTEFGSTLTAFSRNRQRDRVIANWGHEKYFVPAFDDGLAGSKIALFGCPEVEVLATLEGIERAEGLPCPEIDGVWGKVSPGATASYLIIGFGEKNIDEAIDLTRQAGLRYLYHGGPFSTWGHFLLNPDSFPNGWAGLKQCVEKAKEAGIHLGVHTLSNFITTNDPYVTPEPDPRLARVGTSALSEDIDATQKEIPIDEPAWFSQMKNNTLRTVMVGQELIRYGSVSMDGSRKLLECERGAFGTRSGLHPAGTAIHKLMDHPYNTFLADMELQEEMAKRLAKLFNETGLRQISFDGLEGCWAGGHGQYARTRFVKTWYDHLSEELKGHVIVDASNPGHFFWHIYTRMNWGEPWYAGFRESQTLYRLKNQRYFRRNRMPSMLGWFRMSPSTSLEDAEWLLARAAGFDAGFCLVTSPAVVRQNGLGPIILESIKQWEAARMAGAFLESQKESLRDIKQEFHLGPIEEGVWDLVPVLSVKNAEALTACEVENPHHEQPLRFTLQSVGESRVDDLSIEIDGEKKLTLPLSLKAGCILKYEGGDEAILYDAHWKQTGRLAIDSNLLRFMKGSHMVQFLCPLMEGEEPDIKVEYRLYGKAERIHAVRR